MQVGVLEIVCNQQSGECYAALWGVPVIVYFLGVGLVSVTLALVLIGRRNKE